jgi:peptidoglycan hydrolase FlgJ
MDSMSPLTNSTQTSFPVEQAKLMSLERKLKNHENKEELMKTARQFEGIFFKQMMDAMDKTIERSGFLSGGNGEDMFRGMLYDKISEVNSTRQGGSGFGLAEAIYRQMEHQLPKDQGANVGKSGGGA